MTSSTCSIVEDNLVVIEDDARELGVKIAYTAAWGPAVSTLSAQILEPVVSDTINYLKRALSLNTLREDPRVRAYRDFYWRIGVDPTKTRPSSEALVRRILRGEFPRVNPVVDAGNIASARSMVPIGMYDLEAVSLPLALRLTRGYESFKPIGGGEERLPQGIPVVIDAKGRVIHVYPHRDSAETSIKASTSKALIIAAGVPGIRSETLIEALEILAGLLALLNWKTCTVRLA
ncbi:MAG: phenylalanine--tRNA ligase beta subunit-related protein [Desulfurococcus sp.]|nr:phenylalanine--tRNA ligase beta subunit-related protein [Desulfurococcus sp.]